MNGPTPAGVNDFAFKMGTVNGTGSASANTSMSFDGGTAKPILNFRGM